MSNIPGKSATVNALMENQVWGEDLDGDICFAAPQKPTKQVLCTGRVAADVATLTVQLPVGLTPEAFIAYLKELFPPSFGMVVQPTLSDPDSMDEMEFLTYSLELHQTGHAQSFSRLSEKQLEEIESERIGAEFSTKPWNW